MYGQGINRRLIALVVVLSLTSTARGGYEIAYEITDLGVLAPGMSEGAAINLAGTVVGTSSTASGVDHAFAYDPATGTLGDLGGISGGASFAMAVNTGGTVVGGGTVAGGQTQALEFGAGKVADLGTLAGWTGSTANGINDLGQVVGTATLGQGVSHAFTVDASGKLTDLGTFGGVSTTANGINATGMIVGSIEYANGVTHAFLSPFGSGSIEDLGGLNGGNSQSVGLAINNAGEVVGYGGVASEPLAFRSLPDGTLQSLGTLPGASKGQANAVNDYGQIVGTAIYSGGASEAFYYSDRTGMISLTNSLVNGSGWDIETATGINDLGQITGTGVYNGATHAFLLTPVLTAVPEPSSVVLIGLGLLGLLAARGGLRRNPANSCPMSDDR